MSTPFKPITVGSVEIPNRLWLSPMCMYSCDEDGMPTDFHLVHYGARALGGFGLILTEATAVTPAGRISARDCGIWADTHVPAWRRIVDICHAQGALMGIQLAHAGRKARTNEPAMAPSPVAFPGYPEPQAMTEQDIDDVVTAFADAARRAVTAGFDVVELHAAHGYLLHEFLSPLSNQRTDTHGGTFEDRVCLLLRVVDAVRPLVPGALFVRISATEWTDEGWTTQDSAQLAVLLREHGVDLVDCSTGGNVLVDIPGMPGYQLPMAEKVRETGIPVAGVGLLSTTEEIVDALTRVDAVLLGRAGLREPNLPQRVATELGLDVPAPRQYVRAW